MFSFFSVLFIQFIEIFSENTLTNLLLQTTKLSEFELNILWSFIFEFSILINCNLEHSENILFFKFIFDISKLDKSNNNKEVHPLNI